VGPIVVVAAIAGSSVGLAALGIASAIRGRRHRAARRQALAALAEAVGLGGVTFDGTDALSGTHGALRVRCETRVLVRVRPVAAVTIDGIARDLSMRPYGMLARVERARGQAPFESGDEAFDRALHVRGAPLTLRALLDAETRARAHDAVCGRPLGRAAMLAIAGGAMAAQFAGEWFEDTPRLAEGVRGLVDLAHRLEPADAEPERLARIVRTDPLARVRLLALRALVKAAPGSTEAARAVRHAYTDADGAVRLRAAVMGGDKAGRQVLRALAAATDVADDLSAEAIEALGRTIGRPAMRAILEGCPAGRPRTQEGVLRVLEGGDADDAAAIASALVRFDDRVAAIGVAILGALAAPGTEDALLAAAARADPAVRLAVAHALGAVGSARAVPVLHELEAQGGPVLRAAREAVVAVQARLSGASPGQVALASGGEGRLAVAEHDGRVSLDGAPAARSED
jgi:hypothetical protein